MTGCRHNLMMEGLAILIAAGMAAEGWWLAENLRAARVASLTWARNEQEWGRLTALQPAPTLARVRATEAELARARRALADLGERLGRGDRTAAQPGIAAHPPLSRTDAFFELTGFIRSMREQAQHAGVGVRPDEHFGFSAYANEGPATDLIAAVDRQRRIAGVLLETLWTTHPRQLEVVQRTRPRGAVRNAAPVVPSGGAVSSGEADFFSMDPRLSVGEPDQVATDAFRLTFVGHTPALRRFLNGLAASGLPLVVRSVAVEPVANPPQKRGASPGEGDPLVLVVRPGWSRFSVTMESFVIVAPPEATEGSAAASPQAGPPASSRSWPAPPAQRRGHGWVYDVFTPPSLYYDQRARTLSAGTALEASPAADARFDLELLQVQRGRFRWQLVGYAAGADGLRGIFADSDTGETVLGRAGDQLGDSELTVQSLTLSRPDVALDGTPTSAVVAAATVADEATGENVVLTNQEPCQAGDPLGLFASRRSPGFRRALKEGDSVALNGANYCVEQLDLQPAQAVVARMAPGESEPLILALMPPPPSPPVLAPADKTAGCFPNPP
jgi:hypothetical protein